MRKDKKLVKGHDLFPKDGRSMSVLDIYDLFARLLADEVDVFEVTLAQYVEIVSRLIEMDKIPHDWDGKRIYNIVLKING